MTEDQMILLATAGVIGGNLYIVSLVWRFTGFILRIHAENYIKMKEVTNDRA